MADVICKPKGAHEAFAKFFEAPTRPALRTLLKENFGEFNHIDFKETWIDGAKLARHVLGLANFGGGVIIVGVKEESDKSLVAAGIGAIKDKADIHASIKKFIPPSLKVEILDLPFPDSEYPAIKGKLFQVVLVEDDPEHLPFVAMADGEGIADGAVYIRDQVATRPASHDQMQMVLNRRISTGHSTTKAMTLREHLDELQALFDGIRTHLGFSSLSLELLAPLAGPANPYYPNEGMEAFVSRMIEDKKKVIQSIISNASRD